MSLFSFFSLMCVCQPSLTLCNTMDCSPPGSSVHGIFQARVPEWVAISFSRGSSQLRIEPAALKSLALAGGSFTTSATWEAPLCPCRSFESIEYSSLHSDAVGPCWLSFWYTAVCIWEKAMAPHSSTLVWKIPWMGSHRVGHDWSDLAVAVAVL